MNFGASYILQHLKYVVTNVFFSDGDVKISNGKSRKDIELGGKIFNMYKTCLLASCLKNKIGIHFRK